MWPRVGEGRCVGHFTAQHEEGKGCGPRGGEAAGTLGPQWFWEGRGWQERRRKGRAAAACMRPPLGGTAREMPGRFRGGSHPNREGSVAGGGLTRGLS